MSEKPPSLHPGGSPWKAVALVGPSNSGKTGLICRLLGWFQTQGQEVAVLKHSHHLNLGDNSKDTGRYRQAGAANVAQLDFELLGECLRGKRADERRGSQNL